MPNSDAAARESRAATSDENTAIVRRVWLALTCIVLLGAALRLFGLARYSLWYDEGTTMYAAGLAAESPLRLLDPDILTEPPLVPLLVYALKAFASALGLDLAPGTYRTDFLVRLIPCAFSVASIPLGFAVARRFTTSVGVGLLVALLMAISPFHIFYAQEVRPYSTMTFFVLAALWLLGRALETNGAAHWIGYTLVLALATYNHFFTVWYVASLGLAVLLVLALRRRLSSKWIASQIALFILILPAVRQGLVINSVIAGIETSWYPPVTIKTGIITVKTFFAGYSPHTLAYYPLLALGVTFAAIGVWSLRRRTESLAVLLVVGVAPIGGNLIVWNMRAFSYYEHRLFIVCGVVFLILVAAGLLAIRLQSARIIAAIAWMALSVPCLADYYAQRIHPSAEHRLGVRYKIANRDVSNRIRADIEDGDVVGEFSHVTHFPLKSHYLPGTPLVTVGFTASDRQGMLDAYPHESVWEHAGALPVRIDEVARDYGRMWYVDSWWEPFSPPPWHPYYRPWLVRHGVMELEEGYFGVRLGLFDFGAMAGAAVCMEQTADAGTFSVPRYIDERGAPVGKPTTIPIDAHSNFVLERNIETGAVTIHNRSDRERTFRARLYACEDAVEPLAFNRSEPEADSWRPIIHGNAGFLDDLDPIKTSAALKRGRRESASVFADVRLPAGTHAVFAYLWTEAELTNTSRATLQFGVDDRSADDGARKIEIGTITPWGPATASKWQWHRVGEIRSNGTAQRVTITASLPGQLERAFADLGRVIFKPAGTGESTSHIEPISTSTVVVGPDASQALELPAQQRAGRFDVFVDETATGEVRFVNWYVIQ